MKSITQILLYSVFAFQSLGQGQPETNDEAISCICVSYNEWNSMLNDTTLINNVELKSIIDVACILNSFNDSLYSISIQNDSLGRIIKSTVNQLSDGTVVEKSYSYNNLNQLVKEEVTSDNRFSGDANYYYSKHRIEYHFNDGVLIKSIKWDVGNPKEVLIEECLFQY